MKCILLILVLISALNLNAQDKKQQPTKTDTVTIVVKIPPTMEKNIIERDQRVASLKNEITLLQKHTEDDLQSLMELNEVDRNRIIGQPFYKPGQLIFKLKPK